MEASADDISGEADRIRQVILRVLSTVAGDDRGLWLNGELLLGKLDCLDPATRTTVSSWNTSALGGKTQTMEKEEYHDEFTAAPSRRAHLL